VSTIAAWNLYKTTLHCKRPFKIATGVSDTCHGLLLELRDDQGRSGWGEGVPLPVLTGETLKGACSALADIWLPGLVGRDPSHFQSLKTWMHKAMIGHTAARCAIDLALHDLVAGEWNIPCWKLLGGDNRAVATNYSIGLCSPSEAAEQARSLVESEYQIVKLKIGEDPDLDLERVAAVRAAIGPEIRLRVDANEGWNYLQAQRFLRRAGAYHIEFIEQPLARSDWEGLRRLRQQSAIPICADESLRGVQEARHLAQLEAVDIFNLKLMKCGGLMEAREIVAIARAHGISLMVGGMVGESSLAVGAAIALASSMDFEYADLDADLLLRDSCWTSEPPCLQVGWRQNSSAPGWGLGNPDPSRLERVAGS